MRRSALLVFEILERFWQTRNCTLVDMKVEFGVAEDGSILLADIIDSDTWRIWPAGDKSLMVDKTVYINLTSVTNSDLETVKRNYSWVVEQLSTIVPPKKHRVVVLMGSASDVTHGKQISTCCRSLGLDVELRVCSFDKGSEEAFRIVREYEAAISNLVFVAVDGRSHGLGTVLAGNSSCPVINCLSDCLNLPSGIGFATVPNPEAAALHAASILGLDNFMVWSKLQASRLDNFITLIKADKEMRRTCNV
ncbi:hypothetical protein M5D96_003881 [Drosophila gunungcola]|uniref:PurE domain-containing protein n=2 Tax=Drosophila gunungcola TaxID=103775 RepID=A0A9P9YTF7_9MUSC|nr:hypothetical protein M5D96_003881 [Drosophila gunungcola]